MSRLHLTFDLIATYAFEHVSGYLYNQTVNLIKMQKISPFLWFNDNAEDAVQFYTSLFAESKLIGFMRPSPDAPVLTGSFELAGQAFTALNGGPLFKFTPAISLFVNADTEEEIDALWEKLKEGGLVLMGLNAYPFSRKFGWVQDKFGLSWQLSLTDDVQSQKVIPFLMFTGSQHGKAAEAISFYTSLFSESGIYHIDRYTTGEIDPEGSVKHAKFYLEGQDFMAIDSKGPHHFTFTEAFSFYVKCDTQTEIDYFWTQLTANGGEESQCGWLKDRFGVSWQIVPPVLIKMLGDPNAAKAQQVMQAMLKMRKIEIAKLEEAYARVS